MRLAYNILYSVVIVCALPVFCFRLFLGHKYRRSFLGRLGLVLPPATSPDAPPPVWFHALSVGEVLSAVPLIRKFRATRPDIPVVVSAATETGLDIARRELAQDVDAIFYAPLDIYYAVERVLNRIRPRLFVLVETDIWPNLLWSLRRRKVPALLINARMSERSYRFYRRARFYMAPVLNLFEVIGVQAPVYADRMIHMGAHESRVMVGGNLKCDQEHHTLSPEERRELAASFGWNPSSNRVLVAGSVHEGEDETVLAAFAKLYGAEASLRLIVAPRDFRRSDRICAMALAKGLSCAKRSAVEGDAAVMVLDTMGELKRVYAVGEAAFVGGSLIAGGGHNPLEPAAQKKPVCFGPHMEDFPEVSRLLIEAGGAQVVHAEEQLRRFWEDTLKNPRRATEMGQKAYLAWTSSRGSLQTYMNCLDRFLY